MRLPAAIAAVSPRTCVLYEKRKADTHLHKCKGAGFLFSCTTYCLHAKYRQIAMTQKRRKKNRRTKRYALSAKSILGLISAFRCSLARLSPVISMCLNFSRKVGSVLFIFGSAICIIPFVYLKCLCISEIYMSDIVISLLFRVTQWNEIVKNFLKANSIADGR